MRTSILCLLGLLPGTALIAQCTASIPANAIVITSSTAGVVSGNDQAFWVCPEAFQQLFTGSNNQIFIEAGAWVSVNGNGNDVHYKGSTPIGIFGSSNYIYATSTAANSDQGTGNFVNVCGAGAVVFNYASAPANGCASVGIEEEQLATLQLYLDPIQGALVVNAPDMQVQSLRVVDMKGREVALFHQAGTPYDVRTLAPGSYVVQLITDMGTTVRRFTKM